MFLNIFFFSHFNSFTCHVWSAIVPRFWSQGVVGSTAERKNVQSGFRLCARVMCITVGGGKVPK